MNTTDDQDLMLGFVWLLGTVIGAMGVVAFLVFIIHSVATSVAERRRQEQLWRAQVLQGVNHPRFYYESYERQW